MLPLGFSVAAQPRCKLFLIRWKLLVEKIVTCFEANCLSLLIDRYLNLKLQLL
jgi:hypothetical protein